MRIPVAYEPGYEKARASNPELADKYVEYTLIGDPEADSLVNAIAAADSRAAGRIHQGWDG